MKLLQVTLTQDCFFSTKHQEVFKAISELADSGKPYDAVLVEQKLNQSKSLVNASLPNDHHD